MIPVTKPYIPDLKKLNKQLSRANSTEWLTNFGPLHNELTSRLEEYLGVKNLLLVSNGTLALQIAYKALGLKDNVLTTPFSFVATSSTLVWEGLKPKYCDIDNRTLNIDPHSLPEKNLKTTGIVAVHVYGNPCDTNKLDTYCKKHNLKLVYDGAHAFGVKKSNKSVLSAGDATTLSLHATKVFHTIEGGAIIFKNKKHYDIAKQLINFGLDEKKQINRVGINSKLNEYQSAVGLVLLDEIDSILERRIGILDYYHTKLKDYVILPFQEKNCSKNGAYAPIILESEKQLLKLENYLSLAGIQTRRYFYPSLNELKCFSAKKQSCPISEDISRRVLCLPMYTTLKKNEQKFIVESVLKGLKG